MFPFVKILVFVLLTTPKKIWIFSVRGSSFVHLNGLYVLNGSYVNDIFLLTITPNQEFCKVYDIRRLIYMIQ